MEVELNIHEPTNSVDEDGWSDEDDEEHEGDTTAEQARQGRDIQGIPWEHIQPTTTRETYREQRLKDYKNYLNLPPSYDQLEEQSPVDKTEPFFSFQLNTRKVRCTIVHFQLRHLVWATSKHDVYVTHQNVVNHWNPITQRATEVANLAGTRHGTFGRVQISTMAVAGNLLVIGGFNGEIVVKNLNQEGYAHCSRITADENAITNAVEIFEAPCGGTRVLAANNDSIVRCFDVPTFTCLSRFEHEWAVNYAAVSPDHKLVAVVGDSPDGLLTDSTTGKVVATLKGHLDFSFAAAWHPDGVTFATGNQDTTARLWDVRHLKTSVAGIPLISQVTGGAGLSLE
ncbi:hypothetical protein CYMTET_20251 [Cymbomonas tetramitiformis]|uniref:Uncharacterized protein n=1 Tax=Cymbomonas tetramitiformis TaxID=36881 RepID=A0AAE0G4E9_9CHLO|nr:hypothetical protein CYMTET_20251 [Cymbomonas tetramitiformis]